MEQSIKAHSVFNATADKIFPVYSKYRSEINPQPAFISLDIRSGEVDADYSGEIGNAVPADVWHGLVIRFHINPMSTNDEIERMIADNLPTLQRILDGAEEAWNGNNYVGRFTDEARDLIDELCRELETENESQICTLAEFLQDDIFPADGQCLDQFVADLAEMNGENGYYYTTQAAPSIDDVRDSLLDLWADHLYGGNDLPEEAARVLLDDGRCDDSAWVEELREFAGQAE